jgi:hypothetical protein
MLVHCLWAAATAAAAGLDHKKIHRSYEQGDFEVVTASLEEFMRENPEHPRADSIFIAKHLAVVYSANPVTRERGKYYMVRLLELLPSAKLVDMYVSDEIDRIFEKVREEYDIRRRALGKGVPDPERPEDSAPAASAQASAAPAPAAGPTGSGAQAKAGPASPKDPGKVLKRGVWIAGGIGLVAGGTLVYHLLQEEPRRADVVYPVPK